ncbi:hypothetical protein cypCar_00002804 [Cyprinus carpio]|nr:hypothetical protein cypCar_00002804 [Cyprinus carpio]
MYAKGKNSVPSDSQAREKLALYVYEYLLHGGSSEISTDLFRDPMGEEHNIRRAARVLTLMVVSAAATQSPVIGSPPGDGMPLPPGFFQQFMSPRYPGGPRGSLRIPNQALGPGNQMLLPSGMDPTRQPGVLQEEGHGQILQVTIRTFSPQMPYSSASPGSYSGPPAGGGPLGTPIMPSPADSNNSSDNMYSLISSVPPNGNRPNFPLGSGPDGPIGSMASMEPHHMNGSLAGSGDIESLPKSSPGNLSMNNQPGTPRDDGEMGANFLNPFQSESYSPNMTMSV